MTKNLKPGSLCLHSGYEPKNGEPIELPIVQSTTFKYENDYVLIEGKGNNTIDLIKIKNNQILEDSEMLEDMIQVGVNDVLKQIKTEKDKKLGKYTNGMGGIL